MGNRINIGLIYKMRLMRLVALLLNKDMDEYDVFDDVVTYMSWLEDEMD